MPTYGENDSVQQYQDYYNYHKNWIDGGKSWIGPYDNMIVSAKAFPEGGIWRDNTITQFSQTLSCTITESKVTKIQSNRGKWDLRFGIKSDSASEAGEEEDPDATLSCTWTTNMAQYTFPLEVYLNSQELKEVYYWKTGSDLDLKANYQYKDVEGMQHSLSGMALSVAQREFGGNEDVIRFFPQATRTTYLKAQIDPRDNPVMPSYIENLPKLNDFVNGLSMDWLKTEYAWSSDQNGNWTLTESWMGSPKDSGGWDIYLYGDDGVRWEFVNTAGAHN